jgi:hypothetical protein
MRVKKRVKRGVKQGIKSVKLAPPEAYLAGGACWWEVPQCCFSLPPRAAESYSFALLS